MATGTYCGQHWLTRTAALHGETEWQIVTVARWRRDGASWKTIAQRLDNANPARVQRWLQRQFRIEGRPGTPPYDDGQPWPERRRDITQAFERWLEQHA